MKPTVKTLLGSKDMILRWVDPSSYVQQAVTLMNTHKIGSVVVLSPGGGLAGIFTERDVLMRVVGSCLDARTTRIYKVMTEQVISISSETTIEEAMFLMSENRVRHLPVVDGDRVVGIISMGDVNKWLVNLHSAEAESLRSYVAGAYPG